MFEIFSMRQDQQTLLAHIELTYDIRQSKYESWVGQVSM
jgi:hypothetical protein